MGILTTAARAGKAAAAAGQAAKRAETVTKLKLPLAQVADAPSPTHVAKSAAELAATRAGKLAEARAALPPAQVVLNGRSFSAVATEAQALMAKFDTSPASTSVREWIALRKAAELSIKNPGTLTPQTAAVGAKIREFLSFGVGPSEDVVISGRRLSIDVTNPGWKSTSPKLDRAALDFEVGRDDTTRKSFRAAQEAHLTKHDPQLAALFKERAQLQRIVANPKLPHSVRHSTNDILRDMNGGLSDVLDYHALQNYGAALR